MYGRGLRGLAIATVLSITVAFALVFFYAPLDADQGFIQKIFYVHVPLAITALCGFVFGGVLGAMHLRTGERSWDIRAYVAIHMGLIFGVGALLTGAIWAKASWGHWWVWSDPPLTSFLIVMLLFTTYQPLRFSIEDPERQARYASALATVGADPVPAAAQRRQVGGRRVHRVPGARARVRGDHGHPAGANRARAGRAPAGRRAAPPGGRRSRCPRSRPPARAGGMSELLAIG